MNTDAPFPEAEEAWWRVQKIQTKLHQWAIDDPDRRFDDLWNLVYDPDVLADAWHRVKSNRGVRSAGVDGITAHYISVVRGEQAFLSELRDDLKARRFQPVPVREVMIPKPGGKRRRLGIATVRDGWILRSPAGWNLRWLLAWPPRRHPEGDGLLITALVHHQATVGAGVVLGSNVFNLAALLGLGAVVAGNISLHRKVVVFSGYGGHGGRCGVSLERRRPALGRGLAWSSSSSFSFPLSPCLGAHRRILGRLHSADDDGQQWITAAIVEEESELEEAIHPRRGTARRRLDGRRLHLVVVVVASVAMETGRDLAGRALRRSRDHRRRPRLGRRRPACPTPSLPSTWPGGVEGRPR